MNYQKMDDSDVRKKLAEALEHVKFALKLCMIQHREGRLFVFEHPVGATSWGTTMMSEVAKQDGVYQVNFDFCTLGMESTMKDGTPAPAKKRTKVMTNSGHVAGALRRCQCRGEHIHAHLEGGRAKGCEVYPRYFCELLVTAVEREVSDAEWLEKIYTKMEASRHIEGLMAIVQKLEKEQEVPPHEDDAEDLQR
jgi:hypothetical protein